MRGNFLALPEQAGTVRPWQQAWRKTRYWWVDFPFTLSVLEELRAPALESCMRRY